MTILDRLNFQFFEALESSETLLRQTYLVRPVETDVYCGVLDQGTTVFASDKIVCKLGTVHKGAYVWMFDEATMTLTLRTTLAFLRRSSDHERRLNAPTS